MERRLTPQEAFTDFLEWVKISGKWDSLTKAEKNRIITARRDLDGLRGEKFRLKEGRIAAILGDYGGGRYVPDNGFLINEP